MASFIVGSYVFLYGELDEDIYIDKSLEYVSNLHPDYICKLKKSLYRLKLALWTCYGKFAQYLYFCIYDAPHSDPTMFVKKQKNFHLHMVVLLYLVDMIIAWNNDNEVSRQLQEEFAIRFEWS